MPMKVKLEKQKLLFLKKEKLYTISVGEKEIEVMKYMEVDEEFGNYDADWYFYDEEVGRAWFETLSEDEKEEFSDFISELDS